MRAAAAAASRPSAPSAVPGVPAAHRVAPHGCSRFPPRRRAAGRERGAQASRSRGGWRAVAGHMGDVPARPVRGALEPTAGGGLRPGRGLPRASAAVGAGGLGGQGVPVGSPRPRGPDAGTCNCLACGGYRCVQRGNGSPGWAGGYEGGHCGPGPDGGRAPGPGSRARGPTLELCRRRFISLRKHLPSSEGRGRGTSRTISFSLGLQVFVLPEMVDKTSLVLACLESSTDIYRTPTVGQMFSRLGIEWRTQHRGPRR